MRLTIAFLLMTSLLSAGLPELEQSVQKELRLTNYPPKRVQRNPKWEGILDVAIIGAGMSGQAAAFALKREGIDDIMLFDQAKEGREGPWSNYARMKTLLSVKTQMGPAYWVPSLTYEAYHRARFGDEAWEKVFKVPTHYWGEYLFWLRKVLDLPVKNGWELIRLEPEADFFHLYFQNGKEVFARRVILANGREGLGGHVVPDYVYDLPKERWFIANQPIDMQRLNGKRVAVIGAGPTAYDAGTAAAEAGAEVVTLFCRRKEPLIRNKQRELYFPAFYRDFYAMEEELHWDFVAHLYDCGMFLPPDETVARFEKTHATIERGVLIKGASWDEEILLETSQGTHVFDYLIVAAGYYIDLHENPLVAPFADHIALWKDRKSGGDPRLGAFPYLGSHFQFQGDLPFLKHLYCFSFAAFMSHGTSAGDLPGISFGARRLAEGIAAELFLEDARQLFEDWKASPLQWR